MNLTLPGRLSTSYPHVDCEISSSMKLFQSICRLLGAHYFRPRTFAEAQRCTSKPEYLGWKQLVHLAGPGSETGSETAKAAAETTSTPDAEGFVLAVV